MEIGSPSAAVSVGGGSIGGGAQPSVKPSKRILTYAGSARVANTCKSSRAIVVSVATDNGGSSFQIPFYERPSVRPNGRVIGSGTASGAARGLAR